MKTRTLLFLLLCVVLGYSVVFAQSHSGRLNVGATQLATGQIKVGERLTSTDGLTIDPGIYRITISLDSSGEPQFLLTPVKSLQGSNAPGIEKNAVNQVPSKERPILLGARTSKNLLVSGIASNLGGLFQLSTIAPTETKLTFTSKQFDAYSVLGRSPDSKMADLIPTFLSLEHMASCGQDCTEGYVKVVVRNDGNAPAAGKWNITILEPQLYVGTVSDLPAGSESTMVSTVKIKLPCCGATYMEAEVHADFYNKDNADSNETNNVKRFSINLKQ